MPGATSAKNKPKPAPAATAAPPPKPATVRPAAEIVYPYLTINGIEVPAVKTLLTFDKAVKLIGYVQQPDGESWADSCMAVNCLGRPVRCSANAHNRPFDLATGNGYKQEILHRRWRLNGETIVVDKTAEVISGQHRLWGFIDAVLEWRKGDPFWRKIWPTEPVLPALVVCGVEASQELRATLDNVRPRQLSDTIYTSEIFADLKPNERKECSRMLDAAVDMFWKRTGAGLDEHRKFQTHQASHDLLDRHPSLKKAVKHVFTENKDRAISVLKVSPGQCAALLYLFAAQKTDRTEYEADRTEANVDLSLWDKAEEFFVCLSGKTGPHAVLKKVLAAIVEGKHGTKELNDKKVAAVINAWLEFAAGKGGAVTEKNVLPVMVPNAASGEIILDIEKLRIVGRIADGKHVEGLDLGMKPEPDDDDDDETAEERKAEKREERARELAQKKTGIAAPTANLVFAAVEKVRRAHPGKLLIWKTGAGYTTWDADAEAVAASRGTKAKDRQDLGMKQFSLPVETILADLATELRIKGFKPALVENEGEKVTDLVAAPKPPAAPKPAPAPANVNGAAAKPRTPAPVIKPAAGGPKLRGGIGT